MTIQMEPEDVAKLAHACQRAGLLLRPVHGAVRAHGAVDTGMAVTTMRVAQAVDALAGRLQLMAKALAEDAAALTRARDTCVGTDRWIARGIPDRPLPSTPMIGPPVPVHVPQPGGEWPIYRGEVGPVPTGAVGPVPLGTVREPS